MGKKRRLKERNRTGAVMTDGDVMVIVIDHLIKKSRTEQFKEKLRSIAQGLKGQKYIDESRSPSYKSILLFGYNIFPFTMAEYRQMAVEIRNKGRD